MSGSNQNPVRVGLISLGCAKNLADAEVMLGSLLQNGIEITNDATDADVVIVNTCSFIDSAKEESIDAILESAELREARRREQGLVVAGCLPQRFREELPKLLPEVDAFMGVDQVAQVPQIVRQAMARRAARLSAGAVPPRQRPRTNTLPAQPALVNVDVRPSYVPDFATPRFRLTPGHFAYIKIAEGCNHPCSFCTIPRMRGSYRSRTQADIVREAEQLIAEGVKELNLISQDSTYYGLDLRPHRSGSIAAPERFRAATRSLPEDAATLCTLLRALNEVPGEFWVRLLYTHPAHWTDELIETIARCPKVVRYIDMPLQHIHPVMLERMRRETTPEGIVELIAKLRTRLPGIALRTTFIVGFPGETEAYFETLLEFIRETRFERLGVFTYSPEEGTRSAKMLNQVPEALKQRRRRLAMTEQLQVVRQFSESWVGRQTRVLVEKRATNAERPRAEVSSWEHGLVRRGVSKSARVEGPCSIARGEQDAPDIDGRVYVRGDLTPGQFARVRIVGQADYDLIAQPV